MEWKGFISLLFAILMGFLCSSQAYDFYVGGRDGWVLNPSANFNQWAERMRFQVNDTIGKSTSLSLKIFNGFFFFF